MLILCSIRLSPIILYAVIIIIIYAVIITMIVIIIIIIIIVVIIVIIIITIILIIISISLFRRESLSGQSTESRKRIYKIRVPEIRLYHLLRSNRRKYTLEVRTLNQVLTVRYNIFMSILSVEIEYL